MECMMKMFQSRDLISKIPLLGEYSFQVPVVGMQAFSHTPPPHLPSCWSDIEALTSRDGW